VHAEELLDGLADLRLVRVRVHLEDVLAAADQAVALLGDDRRQEHLVRMEAHEALPSTSGSAPSVTRTARAQTTATVFSSPGNGDQNLFEVAKRLDERRLVLARDDQQRQLLSPRGDERCRGGSRRLGEHGVADDTQRPFRRVVRQRRAERGMTGLLVDLDSKLRHRRREDDAAAW